MEKPNTSTTITSANPSTCSKNSNNNNTSSTRSDSKLYKGVRKRKWGKWVSEIRLPNSRERIWLGSHDTQEKAARAFDAALYCLRGRHASFNFPDTPLNINVATQHSFSPQEIQEIAAKFANETPIEMMTQGEEEQEQEQVVPLQEIGANSNSTTSAYSSSPIYDKNGEMPVDLRTMDTTFSHMFDDLNGIGCSDFGQYYEKMEYSGELLYSNQFYEDNNGHQIEAEDDAFSNHSFLWSWNF